MHTARQAGDRFRLDGDTPTVTVTDARNDTQAAGNRFHHKHEQLQNLAWLLEQMVPGRGLTVGSADGLENWDQVIVGFVPPKDPSHFDLPSAYRIETIEPGSGSNHITPLFSTTPTPGVTTPEPK